MLKHCSPSSVDLRRRSRRNLLSIIDNVNEEDSCDTSTSSAEMFKHVIEDLTEEELDLCEDQISVRSFSSHSSGTNRTAVNNELSSIQSKSVLPKSRIVPKEPMAAATSIPLKVYARCLRSDIEYKTLIVNNATTCRDLIWMLLSKYRMRHRDPKLFYLTMDIYIKRTGIPLKRTLNLEDEARPAELKSCHPWGECKFTLQMRKGGLVRIHDSILMAESKYKCLLISEQTTARDVIKLLFHCYGLEAMESQIDKYCLYEHLPPVQRKLEPDECPVYVQSQWSSPEKSRLVLRLIEASSTAMTQAQVFSARPARIIEDAGDEEAEDSMMMHLDTSYCSSGESTASSEFSALRFRDSPMSASSRSNASTDSGLKSSLMMNANRSSEELEVEVPTTSSQPQFIKSENSHHHPLFKKNTTVISCHHHKGLKCTQMTLARHYSLSSLLEALPAASVDAEDLVDIKHASLSSLSSSSRCSDYDGYFYI